MEVVDGLVDEHRFLLDGGVVDDDIESSVVATGHVVDDLDHASLVGHITGKKRRASTGSIDFGPVADLGDGSLSGRDVSIDRDYGGAFSSEGFDDRFADASRPAGDDRDTSI
jgi:hypothetical protein